MNLNLVTGFQPALRPPFTAQQVADAPPAFHVALGLKTMSVLLRRIASAAKVPPAESALKDPERAGDLSMGVQSSARAAHISLDAIVRHLEIHRDQLDAAGELIANRRRATQAESDHPWLKTIGSINERLSVLPPDKRADAERRLDALAVRYRHQSDQASQAIAMGRAKMPQTLRLIHECVHQTMMGALDALAVRQAMRDVEPGAGKSEIEAAVLAERRVMLQEIRSTVSTNARVFDLEISA